MRRTAQLGLMLIVLFSLTNCSNSDDRLYYDKNYTKEIKAGREDFAFYMARNYIPGASIAIAKDGKLIYSEALGYASKELEVPASRKTKFRIGETSEIFTALAYQRMVEDGLFQSDSTVQHYFPDFPKKVFPVTIDNLVNHTSGIREPYGSEKEDRGFNKSLIKGLDMFKDDPLTTPPNMYVDLSMFNYNLLGVVMEKATGKKFKNLIHELVIDTLHLENTELDNPFLTIKNRSNFFETNIVSQVTNGLSCDLRFRAPAQGLLSNAEDMVKLGNALLESEYVTEAMRERLFNTDMLESGFPSQFSNGWFISETRTGELYYARSGSVLGGGAALLIYPDKKLVVAAIINVTSNIDDIPVFRLADPFSPKPKSKTEETE